ncbi:type II toxin-antitoxin system MqsA family antitoxin [Cupriavidus metallidurans]|nr:type II toxin-antitoxin system MqsA family antitoxin [Cupriavidus metallidurans]MDE4922983.1 type II toxin-antitoxin system MqsA family antitoxin [Cupriavidus metallidurans]
MKCPCCGGAELVRDTRDVPYAYKGETTTVLAVTGDFCPACGEVILDRENGDRYMREISFFSMAVDARR